MRQLSRAAFVLGSTLSACSVGGDERSELLSKQGAEQARAPSEPGDMRRLSDEELTPALTKEAARVLERHGERPIGTEIPLTIGGKPFVARIEEHYHPPGGERRPWGPHKGVSLFVRQ